MPEPKTLSEKIWESHVVHREAGKPDLLYIDLHLVHEVTSAAGVRGAAPAGPQGAPARPDARHRRPQRADHRTATRPGPTRSRSSRCEALRQELRRLRRAATTTSTTCDQGIVHVIGPEQGLTQPGHDHRLRRQPHRHPRRVRRARVRHRHLRGRARPGDPDADRRPSRRRWRSSVDGDSARRRHRQGHHPRRSSARSASAAASATSSSTAASAIRALSMEGRMTVCNMSIEGGARAGLVAPDDTTFAYLEGRPHAPKGAAVGAGARLLAHAADRRGRDVRQRASCSTPPMLVPYVTWGTNPAMVVPVTGRVPDPDGMRRAERPRGRRARADVHGPEARHGDAGHRARPRVHRLVHQLPHRRPARRGRRGRAGSRSTRSVRAMVVPGSRQVKAQAEAEGLDKVFTDAGFEWREAGLLDVPGHEPGHPAARRALRLDLQPQLRGAAGPGRPHPPGQPGDGRRRRHRRPLRRHPRLEAGRTKHGQASRRIRGNAVPLNRTDVDTDQIIPAEYLKRIERTGFGRSSSSSAGARTRIFVLNGPALREGAGPGGRAELRLRLVARARAVGAAGLRLQGDHRAVVRRHLPQQLRQERPAPGPAARGAVQDRSRLGETASPASR